jgi:tetratricopeptide (TPR) repeat protein
VAVNVYWSGSKPLTLYPLHSDLVNVRLRRGVESVPAPRFATTLRPGSAVARGSDGAFQLSGPGGLALRVDLSAAADALQPGEYSVCFSPAIVPDRDIRWVSTEGCFQFTVHEIESPAFQAERLRRLAIELLAQYRCDEASAVTEELLRVHPTSAVAFRIRGIIAELQRRHADAVDDYGRAVQLLRTGGDALLYAPGINLAQSASDLDDQRRAIALLAAVAPELSMLGPAGEAPSCESATTAR